MPLRITVAYDTLCHGGICQSGESRMSWPLYTLAIDISNTLCQMIWSSAMLGNVSFANLLHIEGTCSAGLFAVLSRPSFDFHLPHCTKACSFSSRHGGRCQFGHEVPHAIDIQRHIFPVYPTHDGMLDLTLFNFFLTGTFFKMTGNFKILAKALDVALVDCKVFRQDKICSELQC